jgi:hypothetical protein
MQARGWRGLLAGIMIGTVAAAGGCGSSESGSQLMRTQAEEARLEATKKAMADEKKQQRLEQMKNPMPEKYDKSGKRGGPGR